MTEVTSTVLANALVVDGTGAPGRQADVLIRDAMIAAVGEVEAPAGAQRVDLEGLVLAPGFIDPHTHYDAQVLWDPDLTPSSWHGVTTVVMGNCGIGVAPTRAEHRQLITRSLVNVEGMAEEVLVAGIDWCFESFPEYLDALRRRSLRLNVEAFLSHSPLRVFVMGDAAFTREATDDELQQMAALAADAARAGAVGFATSRSPNHMADDGRPLPSRLASVDELTAIGQAMSEARGAPAVIELALGTAMTMDELATLARDADATVTWTTILAGRSVRGRSSLEQVDDCAAASPHIWPQVTCLPVRILFTMADPPSALSKYPAFAEILSVPRPQRAALYQRDEWVARAEAEMAREWEPLWGRTHQIIADGDTEHIGPSVADLAARNGTTPLRALVDVSCAHDLGARFDVVIGNDDESVLGQLLADRRTLLGLSDAGAHATQLCDAGYATHLLGYWWRATGTLSLEHAVWRLTGQPAAVFGLYDRGRIEPGMAADLVAFSPETVGSSPLRRTYDFPTGADRLVSDGIGIEHVWVRGHLIRSGGTDVPGVGTGRVAGRALR